MFTMFHKMSTVVIEIAQTHKYDVKPESLLLFHPPHHSQPLLFFRQEVASLGSVLPPLCLYCICIIQQIGFSF